MNIRLMRTYLDQQIILRRHERSLCKSAIADVQQESSLLTSSLLLAQTSPNDYFTFFFTNFSFDFFYLKSIIYLLLTSSLLLAQTGPDGFPRKISPHYLFMDPIPNHREEDVWEINKKKLLPVFCWAQFVKMCMHVRRISEVWKLERLLWFHQL